MLQQTKHFYEFGPFRLDTTERLLLRGGEAVALTPKLFDILLVLVSNCGHILEKEEVIKAVWPDTAVEEGSLTRNISTLRKALGENPANPQYIETIPWRGYRFVAPVRASADVSTELVIEEHLRTRIIAEETETNGATETVIVVAEASHAAPSALTVVRNWLRLHSVLAIGLVVVSLAAIAILSLSLRRQPGSHRGADGFSAYNVTLQKLTNTGNALGASLSPDGQFVVYNTIDEGNRGALWLRRVGSKESMQLVPPTPDGIWSFTVSHDNSWIFYVQSDRDEPSRSGTVFRLPILGGTPRKLTEKVDSDVTLSPDDQRVAFDRFKAGGDFDLVTANATDGSDERVIATAKANLGKNFLHPQWSPDGAKILFFNIEERADGNYWSLGEMGAGGGTSKLVLQPRRQRIWFMAWADGGDGIVLNASDPVTNLPQLYYVSYPGGETQRISNDLFYYNGVSVGGDSVVTTQLDRPTSIWVTAGPDVRQARQLTTGGVFFDSLTWTPDGRIVYDAWDDGKHHLWMMDGDGQHRQQLSPENVEDRMPDVSPDGKHVVFLSNRSGAWALWLMDIDGRKRRVAAPVRAGRSVSLLRNGAGRQNNPGSNSD